MLGAVTPSTPNDTGHGRAVITVTILSHDDNARTETLTLAQAFERLVYPACAGLGLLPWGQLVHAEGTAQDQRAGIDWIISCPDGAQHTVAARVSGAIDWGTFTIRYRTERGRLSELTKRARSIASDGTYPDYTVQAYVDRPSARITQAYVVRTRDLYNHVVIPADGDQFVLCGCATRPRWAPGGAQFVPVAITEYGRHHLGARASLIGHGISVGAISPMTAGAGLWGPMR